MLVKENFLFVEYNGVSYPQEYSGKIKEVAAHLDKEAIDYAECYSLHTEYSYGKRKLDSSLLSSFSALRTANKDNVPQLWYSNEWSDEFATFIIQLTNGLQAPKIIEIHPPFSDYCTLDEFCERYRIFEKKIHAIYPETLIVIENRAGSVYHGGKFLFGKSTEIAALCSAIKNYKLDLAIVLDFPQLLTAEGIDTLKFKTEKYQKAINTLSSYCNLIKGIHIWGKKKGATGRWVAHAGNLNTYFGGNKETKSLFIEGIAQICSNGMKRFLVPEVNSGAADLASIMSDLFCS